MSFSDQMSLARDETFRDRVTVAALTAAVDIANESVELASMAYHQRRQSLAFQIINQPSLAPERFAIMVASNPAITAASTDSDIQYTVNSTWDAAAGIAGFEHS